VRYASVCSGLASDRLAFDALGWDCAWFSEIDPFACAVLAARFPETPNLGDMTRITDEEIGRHGSIDLLVGGTPCQGFSVAGRGAGLDDARSGLALSFVLLARRLSPRWVVWENVGGVRNRRHAGDLAAFIGAFRKIGYLGCLRSLDARYFGLAQRRDRVFAVFHPGDWRPPAAVLLEPDCVRRDPAKGRGARTHVAGAVARGLGSGGADEAKPQAGHVVAQTLTGREDKGPDSTDRSKLIVAPPLTGDPMFTLGARTMHGVAHTLRAEGFDGSEDGSGKGTPLVAMHVPDLADPICANEARAYTHEGRGSFRTRNVVAFGARAFGIRADAVRDGVAKTPGADAAGQVRLRDPGLGISEDLAPTLDASAQHAVAVAGEETAGDEVAGDEVANTLKAWTGRNHVEATYVPTATMMVRRLTPLECERLQGLPDLWTLIEYNGKPAKDGPRYRAIGNGIAVPVLAWIGGRLAVVDGLLRARIGAT
jgi:DNA (cytosine-5)-methyltransferase 1